jgi:glycine/D-amino acid oxidase-like deaminating enzyme/nitrite reductase/ring-hydroxylating ferredoxin subunit
MSKLSTGPAWQDPLAAFKGPPLVRDMQCDVCVVGAGIAGLTTAYLLAQAGRQAVVIDGNESPGGGETRFTTAHLSSAIDDRFYEVARIRGEAHAKLAHESHAAAIDQIEMICGADGIDCGFRRLDGYLFAAPGDEKNIDREFDAATAAGCIAEKLAQPPIRSLGSGPCLRFARQATFEPSHYMAGLWSGMLKRNGTFFGRTRARDVTGGDSPEVHTDRGTIRANAVVVATNSPIHTRIVLHSKLAPYSTYAISGPVPRGSVPDALYWDTLDPYHYIRLITGRDRDDPKTDADLLVVGGADHRTGQEANPARRWIDLEQWTRERFSQFGEVANRWSGMVMETLDGLAYIGADPGGARNVYVATGDSGMGMTHGTIAGILLSDLIRGRPNAWTELYDPMRLPIRSTGEFVTEAANAALPYVDWVTGSSVGEVESIRRGEGAVVRKGLTKLAVYRDTGGTLHYRSAVCPHLGGLVRWNSAEKTWDCPCHGSRFHADGEVLHGPAHCSLSRVEGRLAPSSVASPIVDVESQPQRQVL